MIRALVLAAALLAVADLSLQPVLGRDTDMWWLLAAGREIWQRGTLPLVDSFSFTHQGEVWYRIHWLYEWMAYGVYLLGGLDGVVLIRTVLVVTAFALLAAASATRRISPWATAVAMVWAATIGMQYAHVRPHFLTLAMASAFILILERARAGHARGVWLLPPLLILWFNAHGGALVGVALIVVYATADLVERWRWPRDERGVRWGLLLALAVGALFVCPQPLDFVRITLLYSFLPNEYSKIITEAQHFQWRESVSTLLFLALTLPAVVAELRARRVVDGLLVLAFSTLIFRSGRHQYLFIPLLTPVAARSLDLLAAPLRRLVRAWMIGPAAAVLIGVMVWTCADILHFAAPPSRLIRWETLPEAPAAFLRANHLEGRTFGDYNWSGYLIWRLGPPNPVYIDARGDQVYDVAALDAYLPLLLGKPGALETLDRLHVDVVVESHLMSASPLFREQLPGSPDWVKAYDDGAARVWVRRGLVSAHGALEEGGSFMDAFRAGVAAEATDPGKAAALYTQALAMYPDFVSAHMNLGIMLARSGRLDEATAHWRRALELQPDIPSANLDLGIASGEQGRLADAACYFARELEIVPGSEAARKALEALPPPSGCAWRRLRARLAAPFTPLP